MYARLTKNTYSGFTLVEVSIVLVVIGLLIGSILVAVNILQNARITSTISSLQSIQSAVSTYNQNYGVLPGDDAKADTRLGVNFRGGGNGTIGTAASYRTTVTATSGEGSTESLLVWSHLRGAGLIKGDKNDTAFPGNSFGGVFGIQNGAFSGAGIFTSGNNVVCIDNIPGAAAAIIDARQDDGNPSTGSIRAVAGTDVSAASTATSYVETNVYILCTRAL